MVVHGNDGLDEITITDNTKVCEINNGKLITYYINPEEYGITKASMEDISGGTAKENAEIILSILKGDKGPKRDIVLLNSAAALYVGKVVDSLKDGMVLAANLVDSGKAYEKYLELTKKVA